MKKAWRVTERMKEPFCGLSHGVGVILAVVALVILLVLAKGRPWHTVGFAIYGATLIVLYTASTLYHSLKVPPPAEARLMRLDQSAIFLLIAGSYTPLCLVTLRGVWGWSLLSAVWGLAIVGITSTLLWHRAPAAGRVILYVLMGWMVMLAFEPLRAVWPPEAFGWLIAGGVIYSIGTVIFAIDKPHLWPGKFSAHDLWHLFVLGGSACHFVVMARFVA